MIKLTLLLLLTALMRPLMADDIVVREVGGVPVLRAKIHHDGKQIEAHVLIDIGSSTPLVMHSKSVGGLGLTPQIAEGREVDLEFAGNVKWKKIPLQVAAVDLLEELTMKYATELKEYPVIAIVGLGAIKSNVVELDLRKGVLRTLAQATGEVSSREIDYEAKPFGNILQGIGAGQVAVKVRLNLQSEDSFLAPSLLESARKAGEKPNVLQVGDTAFGEQTAFRFETPEGATPGDAVLGAGAIRNHIVTIWPLRGKIAFVPQANVPFPQAEQDYFFALADKNPEGVAAFIQKAPRPRMLDEACLKLWLMRAGNPASTPDQLQQALEIFGANYDSLRRSSVLAMIADELEKTDRPDKEKLVMLALKLAIQQSGKALDSSVVHGVHIRLGRKAFASGDMIQARRHLLSAAFGMPKDGECNYWLGRIYQKMGKPSRAWSRYFQAVLDEKLSADLIKESLAHLDELNRDPEFRKTFNMVIAEQYMEGRLEDLEFHAPTRHALEKDKPRGHVRLVEFFTDATKPENGGPQLAFQALDEYFEGAVAMISYHLNDPMHSEVAVNRRDYYPKDGALEIGAFDGKPLLATNASKAEKLSINAAANFPGFRDACLREKPPAEPEWSLDGTIEREGVKVSGVIKVAGQGAAEDLRLHAILCESAVMAPEASGVFFHHFVARRSLTPPDGLELQHALGKPFAFEIDAVEMRESLTRMLERDGPARGRSRPTYVDPGQLMVVAFVQEQGTRRIVAAKSFSLPQEEEEGL